MAAVGATAKARAGAAFRVHDRDAARRANTDEEIAQDAIGISVVKSQKIGCVLPVAVRRALRHVWVFIKMLGVFVCWYTKGAGKAHAPLRLGFD